MNTTQASNARKLRELGYRFNYTYSRGSSIILQNRVELLTGKLIITNVAVLTNSGHVEMGDVAFE